MGSNLSCLPLSQSPGLEEPRPTTLPVSLDISIQASGTLTSASLRAVIPGGQTTASPLESFPTQTGTSYTWTVSQVPAKGEGHRS